MLNTTTMIDATTVLAAIHAEITVVAARIRVVARMLKKRLEFWLLHKHPMSFVSHHGPSYQHSLCYAGYQLQPATVNSWCAGRFNSENSQRGNGFFAERS